MAGPTPGEVAVLARVNASLAPVQVLLRNAGASPVDGGVSQRFLQRGGVRAALAWLTVATAPESALSGTGAARGGPTPQAGHERVASRPGSQTAFHRRPARAWPAWLEGKGSDREAGKVRDLADDVRHWSATRRHGGTTADVLAVLRSQHRRRRAGRQCHGPRPVEPRVPISAHGDDLDALGELAELETDPSLFPGVAFGAAERARPNAGGITLASIHAVKGREWPHVVVHHATAGLMPHRLAEDIEEERRIFHVGSDPVPDHRLDRPRLAAVAVPRRTGPARVDRPMARPPRMPAEGRLLRRPSRRTSHGGRPGIGGPARGRGSPLHTRATATRSWR